MLEFVMYKDRDYWGYGIQLEENNHEELVKGDYFYAWQFRQDEFSNREYQGGFKSLLEAQQSLSDYIVKRRGVFIYRVIADIVVYHKDNHPCNYYSKVCAPYGAKPPIWFFY